MYYVKYVLARKGFKTFVGLFSAGNKQQAIKCLLKSEPKALHPKAYYTNFVALGVVNVKMPEFLMPGESKGK